MLKISYYKFEQRSYLKYCNGVETFYTYDPQRRRLQNLAVTSSAGTIMDNAYSYDAVSNVLSIANAAPMPQSGKAGGQMSHTYGYDALYRLTSASGTYRGADNKSASYTLAMSYDNMHRIKSKSQHLTQQGVQFNGTLNAGYESHIYISGGLLFISDKRATPLPKATTHQHGNVMQSLVELMPGLSD